MSEWWTYRPSDFLLFSPRTYYRLFELYNADIWPLQIVTLLAGAAVLVLMRSRIEGYGRAIAIVLAMCWLWVAWAFHWQHYSTINWLAPYFAVFFVIEALMLLWIGVFRNRLMLDWNNRSRARAGIAIFAFALFVQPLLGLLARGEWMQVEVFGVAPDPTAIATIGLILATGRASWLASVIPLMWCAFSGLTLYVMSAR